MPAFTFDTTGIDGAPPGHHRPHNAFVKVKSWNAFAAAVADRSPLHSRLSMPSPIGMAMSSSFVVGHWANTTVHIAEQRSGRSRFWRFAVIDRGVWVELPNILGDSSAFGRLDDALPPEAEVTIGACRARRYPAREILRVVESLIASDPAALLDLDHPGDERTEAAYRQRLAHLASGSDAEPGPEARSA